LTSKSYALLWVSAAVERDINERVLLSTNTSTNRAGLLDDQKRGPKSRVGAQIRLPAATAGGEMKTRS
jgi:ABC-type tungstate transport system permease subunit